MHPDRSFSGVVVSVGLAVVLVACGEEAASRAGDTLAPATAVPSVTSGIATAFVHPFEYTPPPGTELAVTTDSEAMYALTEGSEETYPGFGYEPVLGVWGLTVTAGTPGRTHAGGSRDTHALQPGAFLTDLRENPTLAVGPITQAILGGLPARQADVASTGGGAGYPDIHMDGDALVALGFPGRLIAAELGGGTVLVHIWAVSDEELTAWLPTAMQLVGSIAFIDPRSPVQ
jgi:hypothetical protein